MSHTFETVRAEALFVSTLQSSQHPDAKQVRQAVSMTLRRLGRRGCAVSVAGEFGEHPETAVGRMNWALTTIRAVYPTPRATTKSESDPAPLALAS
jgi:hypothetical protein